MYRLLMLVMAVVACVPSAAGAQADRTNPAPGLGSAGYDAAFFPNVSHSNNIKSPEAYLGYPVGSKPASHTDIVGYFEYLDAELPNATLVTYGTTYEGRRLVYLVLSSPDNMARLDDIRAGLGKLSDPRGVGDAEARGVVADHPAVAWLAYGIHGDELSSCDAALELAWHLLAAGDDDTQRIRDEVVVIIDPLQNPDGRTRWIQQLTTWNSVVPNTDTQSMHHRGLWPWGRGNHYQFDLNRDWFAHVHPETRGKVEAIVEWMPHYLLDCHEMGPTNTYLFSPPREPFNPYMVEYIHKWWDRVASDQAAAFDRYGWSYYTREWNEEFFPGYGSSWAIYMGAVGMLFEQAGVDGSSVRRPEGTVMTYRETVHHQLVASYSNLLTVANGRRELLEDFYAIKRANVRGDRSAFVFSPSNDTTKFNRFVEVLRRQGIEVERATESFSARIDQAYPAGDAKTRRTFPAGSAIVRTNQPLKQLVDVILSLDIRIPTSFLEHEKKEILKNRRTRLYDTTGWSLPHAFALEGGFVKSMPGVRSEAFDAPDDPTGGIVAGGRDAVGWAFDCTDSRSFVLLARLLERGYKVRASRKPFRAGGREFPRGSYVIRANANPGRDVADLDAMSRDAGVAVYAFATMLGRGRLADLGGDESRLLREPRIAIVGGNPVTFYNFGAIWHLLDTRLRMRASTLPLSGLARADLTKYNVIVLPNNWGGAADYKDQLGKPGIKKLRDWVGAGGTLIAEGKGAAFLADTSVAIGSARVMRQSLGELDEYAADLEARKRAESPSVDSVGVWDGVSPDEETDAGTKEPAEPDARLKAADERARRLFPRGTVLDVRLDDEHWLTYGCGESVPVLFNTNYAYLTKGATQVPGRLAPATGLRLAGLLWPEARRRWAETAWAARDRVGNGQVILFASLPNFRGYFYGAERLLLNAMILGPGLGTTAHVPW